MRNAQENSAGLMDTTAVEMLDTKVTSKLNLLNAFNNTTTNQSGVISFAKIFRNAKKVVRPAMIIGAIVEYNGKLGIIDTKGKEIAPIKYNAIEKSTRNANGGLFKVRVGDKLGVVNVRGKASREVVAVKYDYVHEDSNGEYTGGYRDIKKTNKAYYLNDNK